MGGGLFSIGYVEMECIEDACQKKKCLESYTFAKLPHIVDTLALRRLLQIKGSPSGFLLVHNVQRYKRICHDI